MHKITGQWAEISYTLKIDILQNVSKMVFMIMEIFLFLRQREKMMKRNYRTDFIIS